MALGIDAVVAKAEAKAGARRVQLTNYAAEVVDVALHLDELVGGDTVAAKNRANAAKAALRGEVSADSLTLADPQDLLRALGGRFTDDQQELVGRILAGELTLANIEMMERRAGAIITPAVEYRIPDAVISAADATADAADAALNAATAAAAADVGHRKASAAAAKTAAEQVKQAADAAKNAVHAPVPAPPTPATPPTPALPAPARS